MPPPILKIPVDDAAFKEFLKTFEKYQSLLGDQDSAWAGINDALIEATEHIEQQKVAAEGLTEEDQKRAIAAKKLSEQRAREDKEQADRDKEAAKRRHKAIEQVKDYAASIKTAAMNLTKWASIDSAVALGTGMLSMYGLDRFGRYAGDARKQAMGLGTSIGALQRANVGMSPYFDASSTIDRVANLQGDPTQYATFAMMGMDPRGKDPAELTLQAAARARAMFQKDKGNLYLAQAQGLTNIFSPEELRRMAGESNKNFAEDQAMSRSKIANQGISDDVARKWQRFMQTLDNASLHIENAFVNKLSVLTPYLEKLEKSFVTLVDTALTPLNLNRIGKGIGDFADWLTSERFTKGFQRFIDDIVVIAQKIDDALVFFNLIPSPNAQNNDDVVGAGTHSMGQDMRSWWTEPQGRDDGSSFKMYSNDAYQQIGRILIGERGRSQAQARAILTNMVAESDLDPFIKGDYVDANGNPTTKDKGRPTAYGLGQWHKSWYPVYEKMFHHSIFSVKNRAQALREQTIFYDKTLRGQSGDKNIDANFKSLGEQFDKLSDVSAAASLLSSRYEVAAGQSGVRTVEAARRGRAALGAPEIKITVTTDSQHNVSTKTKAGAGG
jgi:hypothetical protein